MIKKKTLALVPTSNYAHAQLLCGVKACPVCDVPEPLACLLHHVLKDHWEILELGNDLLTRESLLTLVVDCSISFVSTFRKLFLLNTLHVN